MTIQHGWQTCRACHHPGQDIRAEGDWHLRANPGYWGASAPEVLVLGFSKGATQIAAARAGDFDGVAFAKMRPRLRQVLDALGVDLKGQTIDEALSANGQQLGAASLIRCGLSMMENGKLVTSGTIMPKAARAPFPRHVMRTCIAQHLDPLPASVSRVLLLGTTNAYIHGVKALMREQFPDYCDINEVAFQAQGRTWVFVAHPSPANGEFKEWLSGDASDTSGLKRILAQRALSVVPRPSLSLTTAEPRPAIPCASIPVCPVKSPAMSHSAPTDDVFAQTFHLVRYDGRKIVPVKMKNQDTGRVAFRVVKQGNHKKDSLEVTDEIELLRYCESGQYQVRACPLDRSTPANFIRPLLNHRIVKIPAR
ncbi:hypothetical protein [Rhodanobacter ginsengiterrae]|uniref:hypothetical protein n=1 Tax=Rhodanobacter ginsengiterrae TaxID=2008451 RepID=UPI003CEC1F72